MTSKNHYEILGVSKDADEVVIRAAYKALAQKYHPDKAVAELRINHASRMREINEAYAILGDLAKRKSYDESLGYKEQDSNLENADLKQSSNQVRSGKSFALEGIFLMGFAILLLWIALTMINLS